MLLFIPTYYYYYHLHYYYLYYHYLLIITLMLEHGQDLFLEVVVALKRAVGFFCDEHILLGCRVFCDRLCAFTDSVLCQLSR